MVMPGRRSSPSIRDSGEGLSSVVIDLLRIFKSRYNYKKISDMTGFPVSTLTRYLTGKTVPRGKKALQLLERLLANLNLKLVVNQHIRYLNGYVDLSQVMVNPNLIKVLGAYVINEFAGTKITSILSFDMTVLPLASYVSTMTSRPLGILAPEPLSPNGESIPVIYPDMDGVHAVSRWLLLNQSRKRESILIISSRTPPPKLFNSLHKILKRKGVEVSGIFMIIADEEMLKELNLPPGIKRVHIMKD